MRNRPLLSLASFLLAVGLGAALAGCGGSDDFTIARADVERATELDVPQADLDEVADGNTAFAFDMHRQLATGPENLIFSPYSITMALAMTYAGARGNTEQEIAEVLQFRLPQDRLHAALNGLDQELAQRSTVDLQDETASPPELHTANSTWAQKDYAFLDSFLETLGLNYGAGVRLLDFQEDPDGSREVINKWVEDQTEDRIQDLIPEGAINSLTRLVLANAIYFKASWATPFDPDLTEQRSFTLIDGGTVDIAFMRAPGADGRHARMPSFEAVELPYAGQQVSMLVLVPDEGAFLSFEEQLSPDVLGETLSAMAPASLTLSMPKFEFEWESSLVDPLKDMGMTSPFGENADFSGMDGTRNLAVTEVLHKAFISVDEQGTEAAAATAVIIGETSAPARVEVTIDRPFIFLVRDSETGTILFMGRVMVP